MKIVMNPSPFDEKLNSCDLGKVYLFLLNEIEGEQITGYKDKDMNSGCNGRESSRMHALFSLWEAMVLFTMMEKKKCFKIFLR